MTLYEGKADHRYIVRKINLVQATEIRLKALGLTDGTSIVILNSKRGGSVIFSVRGTRLAVGKMIAESIEVVEVLQEGATKEETMQVKSMQVKAV